MKKLLMLMVSLVAILGLTSCKGKEEEKAYVALDINPDIELVLDGDNKVIDCYASNDDAKVMLQKKDLKGLSFNAALDEIANLSIEMGYLDESNKVLEYSIASNMSNKKIGKLETMIEGSFDKEGKKSNLEIKCNFEPTFTLERQLDALKEEYKNNKEVLKLNANKYKLITAAMASDFTLTLDEALKMSELELIEVIENNRDEAYNYATKAYNEIMVQADKAFNSAQNTFKTLAYTGFYLKNYQDHKINYGAIYGTYQGARMTLEGILESAYLVESYSKKILSNEEVKAILNKLIEAKLILEEDLKELEDNYGNITMDSLNDYLDKVIKNMDDKEVSKALSNVISELNTLEKKIETLINNLAHDHQGEIKEIVNSLNEVSKALGGLGEAMLPDDLKEVLRMYRNELETLTKVFNDGLKGEITLDNLKDYIKLLKDKEASILEVINKDLSKDELKALDDLLKAQDKAYEEAKKALNDALMKAKEKAFQELENFKKQYA